MPIIPPSAIAQYQAWVASLPVSSIGLNVGDWWNNAGTPTRVESIA